MGTFFSIYPSKLFPENCLPDGYFENLTVETVFILKMYCRHIGEEADSLLPDVAKLVAELFGNLLRNLHVVSRRTELLA